MSPARPGWARARCTGAIPDRAALAVALLDEHERQFRTAARRAAAARARRAAGARLAAFYAAMVELLERHLELPWPRRPGPPATAPAPTRSGGRHVHTLLAAAGLDDPDEVLAELLLAPLAVDLHQQLAARGAGRDALRSALTELARRVLDDR